MKSFLLLAGLLLLLGCAGHADARGCKSKRCEVRVISKACSQRRPIACIRFAAIRHHQPLRDMLRVARCESGLDPYNSYAGHHGLYQFLPITWAMTPYAKHSIWSARFQALATAWMWRVGRRGEWACR